ncbi:MAG: hypothetical protein JWL81_900 [Verrucomicrobiales bacterium]|nr:hypothetical protein [Verrucomicrobiales bacterium]
MNDLPEPPPAEPTSPTGRRNRRNRAGSPWPRRLAWGIGGLAGLALGGVIAVKAGIDHYLKSAAFTGQVNAAAGRALNAACRIDGMKWQDSVAYAGTFSADGSEDSAFRRLALSDVRADLDSQALWDRTWKIRTIRVASMSMDFSKNGRLPSAAASPAEGDDPPPAPGWLQSWLPDKTEIGPVQVDHFDFTKSAAGESPALSGSGFALTLKPKLQPAVLEVEARGGEIRMGNETRTLKIARARANLRTGGSELENLEGTVQGAQVTANGTLDPAAGDGIRLTLSITDADLAHWLPEDWLRRCTGMASVKTTLRGSWSDLPELRAEGGFSVKDATLQALPLLNIIAKKTQNATFLRMLIKSATGDFERRGTAGWDLRRIRADAPGLLRLKGAVTLENGDQLRGSLLLGIVPGTLRYLAGAEQSVFLPAVKFEGISGNAGALSPDDAGLLWTRFSLEGTLDSPRENLSDRLAQAWFNATVDEVTALSMEAASTAARTAAGAAESATGAAQSLLDAAPPILEKAPGLIQDSVRGGLNLLENALPR